MLRIVDYPRKAANPEKPVTNNGRRYVTTGDTRARIVRKYKPIRASKPLPPDPTSSWPVMSIVSVHRKTVRPWHLSWKVSRLHLRYVDAGRVRVSGPPRKYQSPRRMTMKGGMTLKRVKTAIVTSGQAFWQCVVMAPAGARWNKQFMLVIRSYMLGVLFRHDE